MAKYFIKTGGKKRFYDGRFQERLERPVSKKYEGYIWSKDFPKVVHKILMQTVFKVFLKAHMTPV